VTRQGILGIDRKCRSATCGRWTFFRIEFEGRKDLCPDCKWPYGRTELGLDVTRFATPKRKLPKDLRMQTPAMKVAKPKRGEYHG
jgi:hypothetical protein